MAGEMEIIFSLSARIHVLLRRETKRITDVEWMTANADYAREILKVSRATGHAELLELSERIENLHPLLPKPKPAKVAPPAAASHTQEADGKYLFTLR